MIMDLEAELERIRQYSAVARHRIRRLDVMLEEQARILNLDPALNAAVFEKRPGGHLITLVEIRVFAVGFVLASLAAFLSGYWTAHFR
jgi:hypothetical protein